MVAPPTASHSRLTNAVGVTTLFHIVVAPLGMRIPAPIAAEAAGRVRFLTFAETAVASPTSAEQSWCQTPLVARRSWRFAVSPVYQKGCSVSSVQTVWPLSLKQTVIVIDSVFLVLQPDEEGNPSHGSCRYCVKARQHRWLRRVARIISKPAQTLLPRVVPEAALQTHS